MMALVPKYAENIIVGTLFRNEWSWYVSPPELWILDLIRYGRYGVEKFGLSELDIPFMTYERPIQIVNSETAPTFLLQDMAEYLVTKEYLGEVVRDRISIEELSHITLEKRNQLFENALELFPSVIVDFDKQVLRTAYAEPMHISFENHTPVGWEGYDEATMPHVPELYRYWVIDGIDYFAFLSNE